MAECGVMPATLLEVIASTIMEDADGNTFFNKICYNADCADLVPAIKCADNISDLEAIIVAKGFGVDSCGNPAWKFRVCVDADAENREQ